MKRRWLTLRWDTALRLSICWITFLNQIQKQREKTLINSNTKFTLTWEFPVENWDSLSKLQDLYCPRWEIHAPICKALETFQLRLWIAKKSFGENVKPNGTYSMLFVLSEISKSRRICVDFEFPSVLRRYTQSIVVRAIISKSSINIATIATDDRSVTWRARKKCSRWLKNVHHHRYH